ncbi:hypothetical protein [Hominenteromicrobium sp.]|uniref:hypothetical protein n=1 Tax=Hominenteromicrobium sp. TaxID=3073581 RepID=UPI003AEFB403
MANVNCLRCRFRHEDNGNCTAVGGFCTAVTAAHCPLLRQYLDTGMTPEAFQSFVVFFQDLIGNQKASEALDRFRQLVKADKDGRLVVLPCKVGTATYYIHYPIVVYPDKSEPEIKRGIFTLCDLDRVGYSVFLTREEAKKALEAMKDE